MLRATLKSLWARKVRLVLSALSIVLGVAFVCGSLMFTDLLRSSFDQIIKGSLADVNVSSEAGGIVGTQPTTPGDLPLLTPAQIDEISAVDGVQKAVGMVSSMQVFPLDKDGDLLSFPGAPGIAMNWHDTPAAGGLTGARIVEGRAPEADDEVVMDPATVERGGYVVGDTVQVSTPVDGIQNLTLVGTGTYGAGSTAGASYLFFTLERIQELVQEGQDGFYAAWVQTTPDADAGKVASAIRDVLPAGFTAETGDELASTIEEQLDVGLGFINIFLLVFAGIALLVATLLILNTFSILVAQRARELALLRAVGAKRSQVRNSVLLEALIIGVLGASLGLAAGYALTWGILAGLRAVGLDLGPVSPSLSWQAVVSSYAIGIVITMIAAYLPARRASRTRPVEALAAAVQSGPEKVGGLPMVGVVLVELGVAGIVCATWLNVPQPLVWFGVSAAMLLIGMVLAAAVIGAPLVWLFGKAFTAMFGEVGKLSQLNAVRQPRRTAATAAMLMIGLALVTTVAILASSTTTSLGDRLAENQRGDFLIAPVSLQPFDAKVIDEMRSVDGVSEVYGYFNSAAQVKGQDEPVSIFGTTKDGLEKGTSLDLIAGTLEADGGVLPAVVATDYATEHGLAIGQLLDLTGPKGSVEVLITGVHNWNTAFQTGQVIVPMEAYEQVADTALVNNVVVFAADGADSEAVRDGLQESVSDQPTVTVSDVHEYVQARIDQFGQLFAVIYALLALAIVISVLGIVNTLGLSVMERTREVGLLRAVGMTRRQLRLMVTLESVIVAILGALLGVLLGIVFGCALVSLLGDQGIDTLVVPGWQLAVFVALAALFGVLAAVLPARRAARLNVLDSIVTE